MRDYESVPGYKSEALGGEVGQVRGVNGVKTLITSVGIRADDDRTKERVLGTSSDEIWSAFKNENPVSPEQIQSEVLKRLLQFGTPKQAYFKALERK